jgi:hypothetical protein
MFWGPAGGKDFWHIGNTMNLMPTVKIFFNEISSRNFFQMFFNEFSTGIFFKLSPKKLIPKRPTGRSNNFGVWESGFGRVAISPITARPPSHVVTARLEQKNLGPPHFFSFVKEKILQLFFCVQFHHEFDRKGKSNEL